ncbi:hypothetical protein [Microvirga flavescens]|uniref:hypothetical protein n=1 Tax=Microvirga flavescens TaxID=2249811 RepID=UPI000DD63210|nr:hypothetical protein [Microvirga flavescens]
MNRAVALRSSITFLIVMFIAAAATLSSQVAIAEALLAISGALFVMMLFFVFAAPTQRPVPIRIRLRD